MAGAARGGQLKDGRQHCDQVRGGGCPLCSWACWLWRVCCACIDHSRSLKPLPVRSGRLGDMIVLTGGENVQPQVSMGSFLFVWTGTTAMVYGVASMLAC